MATTTEAQRLRVQQNLRGGTIAEAFPAGTVVTICTDDEWCTRKGIAGRAGIVHRVTPNGFVQVTIDNTTWTIGISDLIKQEEPAPKALPIRLIPRPVQRLATHHAPTTASGQRGPQARREDDESGPVVMFGKPASYNKTKEIRATLYPKGVDAHEWDDPYLVIEQARFHGEGKEYRVLDRQINSRGGYDREYLSNPLPLKEAKKRAAAILIFRLQEA